jgi:transcriptional regulator with XRE-family HTH domain
MRSFRQYSRQVQARTHLQRRARRMGALVRTARLWPRGDWLHLVREARGETLKDVATRLGVTSSTVLRVELGEARGMIKLDTLRRVASALECDVVYSLVPRVVGSLDVATLRRQRREALALVLTRQLEAMAARSE